jgi:hypothetical protein
LTAHPGIRYSTGETKTRGSWPWTSSGVSQAFGIEAQGGEPLLARDATVRPKRPKYEGLSLLDGSLAGIELFLDLPYLEIARVTSSSDVRYEGVPGSVAPEPLVQLVSVAVPTEGEKRRSFPYERFPVVLIVIFDGNLRIAAKCAGSSRRSQLTALDSTLKLFELQIALFSTVPVVPAVFGHGCAAKLRTRMWGLAFGDSLRRSGERCSTSPTAFTVSIP